ncbi:uncharacterized protein LOC143152956 [Ptiloglossa arizonensis]|uniref:uncharacterized protein LOC143152956 n=1 Tax=Ptiloglossa arizonensis TaxID=3350558 RepID=UPI003FA07208
MAPPFRTSVLERPPLHPRKVMKTGQSRVPCRRERPPQLAPAMTRSTSSLINARRGKSVYEPRRRGEARSRGKTNATRARRDRANYRAITPHPFRRDPARRRVFVPRAIDACAHANLRSRVSNSSVERTIEVVARIAGRKCNQSGSLPRSFIDADRTSLSIKRPLAE